MLNQAPTVNFENLLLCCLHFSGWTVSEGLGFDILCLVHLMI